MHLQAPKTEQVSKLVLYKCIFRSRLSGNFATKTFTCLCISSTKKSFFNLCTDKIGNHGSIWDIQLCFCCINVQEIKDRLFLLLDYWIYTYISWIVILVFWYHFIFLWKTFFKYKNLNLYMLINNDMNDHCNIGGIILIQWSNETQPI